MTTRLVVAVLLGVLGSTISAQQSAIQSSTRAGGITAEMIGRQHGTMTLKKSATDPQYGFSETSPVRVTGGYDTGSRNTYRYLNSLRGPAGEVVHYERVGTCCAFKTKKAVFGDSELLEVYEVHYEGSVAKRVYFNWYDDGEPLVLVGFTAKK